MKSLHLLVPAAALLLLVLLCSAGSPALANDEEMPDKMVKVEFFADPACDGSAEELMFIRIDKSQLSVDASSFPVFRFD